MTKYSISWSKVSSISFCFA